MSSTAGTSRRSPSIVEVAAAAGVSRQTVSRVVNEAPGVLPETKARVLSAITTLGYRRNRAAASLVTRRSGLIGVLAVGSFLFGPTSALSAIEQASREGGYMTLMSTLPSSALDELRPALSATLERDVEAVIVIASRAEMVHRLVSFDSPVPMILVGPRPAGLGGLVALSVDQRAGASMAVDFLVEQGHRDLVLLAGPSDWIDARDRLDAAMERCDAHSLAVRVVRGDWSAASGYEAGRRLCAGPSLPTAVFSANDAMALGMLAALHESGVAVPHEMSVMGFDDVGGSDYYSPPLTTIRQDFVTLGQRVVAASLAMVDGGEPDLTLVPPQLVVRGSVAGPPDRPLTSPLTSPLTER